LLLAVAPRLMKRGREKGGTEGGRKGLGSPVAAIFLAQREHARRRGGEKNEEKGKGPNKVLLCCN